MAEHEAQTEHLRSSSTYKPSQISTPAWNTRIYQPLPPPRFIRLITILPGQPEVSLKLSLMPFNLNDEPDYEALSYMWRPLYYEIFPQITPPSQVNVFLGFI